MIDGVRAELGLRSAGRSWEYRKMTPARHRRFLPALMAAAAGLVAGPAAGEVTETASGRYSCDAAAGRQEFRDVSDFFPGASAAARFRFVGSHGGAENQSFAGMTFQLDTGKRATVLLFAPSSDNDPIDVTLLPPDSNVAFAMEQLRSGRVIEVATTAARGALFVRVNNERGQIRIDEAAITGRSIVCAGSRWEIELTRDPRPPRRY